MTEQELVKHAIAGNQHCLHILLEQHYEMVYGFLIKMSGNVDLSQDLVQETLLKASLSISSFRGECKFSTYLIQIALNEYKKVKRKQKVQHSSSYEDILQQIKHEGDAETKLMFAQALDELQQMSEEKRLSFIMHHYYGYTVDEISHYFCVPSGTTKSRIHAAMSQLRQKLR